MNAVKELVEGGANINVRMTPLYCAVLVQDLHIIKSLIEHQVNINLQNVNGTTALHCAINQENYEIVKLLVKSGANVNKCDNDKVTPIDLAVLKGNKQIVQYHVKTWKT